MILCRKCGHENADDASFCEECNAFLEWSGQRVVADAPASSPAVPATPTQPGPVDRQAPSPSPVPAPAPGATGSSPAPADAPAPRSSQPAATRPPPASPTREASDQPAARPPGEVASTPPPRRPAAAAERQPRSRQPTAQQVARPRPDTKPAQPEPAIKAGDRICPTCGIGNDPARRFCRRCGASLELAVVAVPVRVPWYRRLFRRGQPERFRAGERPRSMEQRGRPRRSILGVVLPLAIVIAVIAAVASYVAVPDVRGRVDQAVASIKRQFLPELTAVTPTSGASAAEVIDGNTTTWWQGGGEQPGLTLRFAPAVDLGAIGITSGAYGDDFAAFRRPSAIRLTPDSGDPITLELADTRDFQSFRIDLPDVARLRVQVVGSRGPATAPVAISELEFKEVR